MKILKLTPIDHDSLVNYLEVLDSINMQSGKPDPELVVLIEKVREAETS